MNIQWNVVTWYSKALSVLVLVVVLPATAFIIGREYGSATNLESQFPSNLNLFLPNTPSGSSASESSKSTNLPANYLLNLPPGLIAKSNLVETLEKRMLYLNDRPFPQKIMIIDEQSNERVGYIEPLAYPLYGDGAYVIEPIRKYFPDSNEWFEYEIRESYIDGVFNQTVSYSNREAVTTEIHPETRNKSQNKVYRFQIPGVCDAGVCTAQEYLVVLPTNEIIFAGLGGDINEDPRFIDMLFRLTPHSESN